MAQPGGKRLFPENDPCIDRIHTQLLHLLTLKPPGSPFRPALVPTREQIAQLVETAFWSSLAANEGRATRFRAAILQEKDAFGYLKLTTPVPYEHSPMVKLAPALADDRFFAISEEGGRLVVWGLCSNPRWFGRDVVSVEVLAPGSVRVGVGPFERYAICDGRANDILVMTASQFAWHLDRALQKTEPNMDMDQLATARRECQALQELARAILAAGHGGTVLVVPGASGTWESSLQSIPYRLTPPDTTVGDFIRGESRDSLTRSELLQQVTDLDLEEAEKARLFDAVSGSPFQDLCGPVRRLASYANVDGAVVLTRELSVLGFGAFIKMPAGDASAPPIHVFRAVPGPQEIVPTSLERSLGTRHQSAARFVSENRDTLAIVLSHDRHVSLMRWDTALNGVSVLRNVESWL